jgi:hypothetical protein
MDPSTVYGISKLAGGGWCAWYHANHGVDGGARGRPQRAPRLQPGSSFTPARIAATIAKRILASTIEYRPDYQQLIAAS